MAKDCPKGFSVCFHCNQTSHRKAKCPQQVQGPVQGFVPTYVRESERQPVKAETPKDRGKAIQLTTEEVRAAPDVVAGMYSFIY